MVHRFSNFLTFNVRFLINLSHQVDLGKSLCYNKFNKTKQEKNQSILSGIPLFTTTRSSNTNKNIVANSFFAQIEHKYDHIHQKYTVESLYIPSKFYLTELYESLNPVLQLTANFGGSILSADLNAKYMVLVGLADNLNTKVPYIIWITL